MSLISTIPINTFWIQVTYSFDCQHKTSIGEADEEDWNEEMDSKHVDDVGLIVVAFSQGVVVWSAGALHALWKVPVEQQGRIIRIK